MSLPTTFNGQVQIGVLGGSGFYKLEGLETVAEVNPETPWGFPSSPITIAKTPAGTHVAFLARHGLAHTILPSEVPARANIAALKHLGVGAILAFSAVGSLQEEIAPEDFVLPTQIIDRTRLGRPNTFFGEGMVAHAMFADPFSANLASILEKCSHVLEESGKKLHTTKTQKGDLTLICMEGPQFSTRAESHMYRSWGAHVINMSVLPEAKLAREAEIAYQMICMATDYDCWRVDEEGVTVEAVMAHVRNNTANAGRLLKAALEEFEKDASVIEKLGQELEGSMKFACITPQHARPAATVEKLDYILPGYY
ncbi:putative methylthioadenosine phosphorylase [Saitoella complicata NRRL Y-17804]|nr:putative methylthioadenosine phosphorylase [Saitoella complicata NRRL Y-17804]ODQ55940.1 putative methylthioadenosine phosphorylase [Saitoella complicata NRRL Y-17804]